jgi:hypothetical protein
LLMLQALGSCLHLQAVSGEHTNWSWKRHAPGHHWQQQNATPDWQTGRQVAAQVAQKQSSGRRRRTCVAHPRACRGTCTSCDRWPRSTSRSPFMMAALA